MKIKVKLVGKKNTIYERKRADRIEDKKEWRGGTL
jgi:hypothetical protein